MLRHIVEKFKTAKVLDILVKITKMRVRMRVRVSLEGAITVYLRLSRNMKMLFVLNFLLLTLFQHYLSHTGILFIWPSFSWDIKTTPIFYNKLLSLIKCQAGLLRGASKSIRFN